MKIKFGTDGIRGTANQELTPEIAFKVGAAIGSLDDADSIALLRDTRESGPLLTLAVMTGLMSAGVDVDYYGVAPTPLAVYLTHKKKYSYAVVVTASHNPYTDNGIKVIGPGGFKISDEVQQKIEKNIAEFPAAERKIGHCQTKYDTSEYQNFLLTSMPSDITGLKIVLDTANGSLSELAPKVFKKTQADITVFNNHPDGKNINRECGSTCLNKFLAGQNLSPLVFDLGFSFDGDGDRVLTFFKDGTVIDGDLELKLLLYYLSKKKIIKSGKAVLTVMSDFKTVEELKEDGVEVFESAVGDSNVFALMKKADADIGAEKSGHLIVRSLLPSGDGLLTALLLCSFYAEDAETFVRIVKSSGRSEILEKNIRTRRAEAIGKNYELITCIKAMKKRGIKAIVRPSGTEPLLRISVQSSSKKWCQFALDSIMAIIERLEE